MIDRQVVLVSANEDRASGEFRHSQSPRRLTCEGANPGPQRKGSRQVERPTPDQSTLSGRDARKVSSKPRRIAQQETLLAQFLNEREDLSG
jgi:hypothetical protein